MPIRQVPHVHELDPNGKVIATTDATSVAGNGFTLTNAEILSVRTALNFTGENIANVTCSAPNKTAVVLGVRVYLR